MKFLSRLNVNKTLLLQLFVVITAFLIMVFLGSHFGSLLVNKYIDQYGNEIIMASSETVKNYLQGYEITLNDTAFFLEWLWTLNPDTETVRKELVRWFEWLQAYDERYTEIISLFGAINGSYITSYNWDIPDNFIPESRIWYIGAYELNGKIFCSDPYADARTGEYVVTFSKLMFDDEGRPFGVIALDVLISVISNLISHIQFMDSGYGILLDSDRRVIEHPHSELFGIQLETITEGSGYADIAQMLIAGKDVSAFDYVSLTGEKNVIYMRELFNGWYIGLALPGEVYYSDVEAMRVILFLTGIILAMLLCGMLTFMHVAKNRSDSASKVKSSFLANMSHEIRTPMNAVIGMTELLLHEPLSERQRDYVNDITSSTHSLLSIINDILDLSKIESGKITLSPINYDFPALIDNINSMFRYVAQKKELEFRLETSGEIPKILYGDDIRLRQVLTNICSNAVKYTEKGYVRLKVTALDDKLIFEVKDTGIGIKKEALPGIFNAFAQDRNEKNRNTVGTGLGLPISKAFVEMMSGTIMLDSEYGQGSVITIIIPLILGSESKVSYETKTETKLTISAPSANILLVDDNIFNLKVAHGLLMLYNIDAKKASSGRESIDLIKKYDFDIVFMDHMMPDMDGIETADEIRKLGGKYKTLPIIALTANAVEGAKEMFIINGFNDFISKPIDINKLTEILTEWLPNEKIIQIKKSASAKPENVTQNRFLDALEKTREINTEIGLSRVSGIENMYIENVRLFHKNFIPEYERLSGFFLDKDIENFSISIHALKSVLSTIGAMKLSEAALQMETASKNKNMKFCMERFPEFGERLLSLHKSLSEIFPKDAKVSEKKAGNSSYLKEQIQIALAAADDYDNDAGMDVVNKLLAHDFGDENNALLEKILTAFKNYEFDRAKETLERLN